MRFGRKPGLIGGEPVSGSDGLRMVEALYTLEMNANIAALRQQRRNARLNRAMTQWFSYWPVAVGILISFIAPLLRDFVEPYRPWGLWVTFPMVALSLRPEVYMGSMIAGLLPTAIMYLQFPLEGLLARFALRGNVTVYGVAIQVLCFHALCIVELWLLNGGLSQVWHLFGH
jgi:hypothetical protein